MPDEDPYRWLEDVTSEAALGWVRERNAETAARLTGTPLYDALRAELLDVLDDTERIPYTVRRGRHLYNYWQDADQVRGLWRRTTLEEYRTPEPAWEPVLDLDALARDEGEDWVWGGATVLHPECRHALVQLSRGGADAVVVREFDLLTKEFVPGGFTLPEAKTGAAWIDPDQLYVATDFGPGTLTASGYPRTVRRWRRGTDPAAAEPVGEVGAEDLAVHAWRDHTEGHQRDFLLKQFDFWRGELTLLGEDGTRTRVDVPEDASAHVERDWLTVDLRSPWLGHPAGTLLAFRFADFLAGRRDAVVLFAPGSGTALEGHSWTRGHLVLNLLVDVTTRMEVLTPTVEGPWDRRPLSDVPPLASAVVTDTDPDSGDEYFLDVSGFLQPSTLLRGEIGGGSEVLRTAPERFDATGLTVRQHFARSADGTRVPYFVVGPEHGGPGPALLTAYGGYEISLTPGYDSLAGRAWLARGGTYVVANIRGGGEYGPEWHQSALKAGRVRSFEDFEAVARDLVARDITTPARLGIQGGSNGGLLTGAALVRHPELYGAVVCDVPVLDLLRFHVMLAGASWTAEFGDPDDPADRPHLAALSPYHHVSDGGDYPPVLLTTSTRDDRVHPGHARKMAARLREAGHDVLLHEATEGGHSAGADHHQIAANSALAHAFLWQTLGRAE
ncbi:prolyl oligopeptidase family serine peptidase [Streptomyces sp. NPDC001941]|uniref:prolyl oligopeptidase family serine peptidase n=1 Tax=Streptomyces sp. NPDC001941 TaxID=3154659 RepID=UPI003327456B